MKSFSELTSASYVSNSDILAISQENSGTYSSKKTTVKEVSDFANQNFAEEYDSTSSYAVGDYCIYESVLYKCIGTTTGAFDSTKWTSVVVTDEMGQGGGGTGGHTIIDENGNPMTARSGLQFVGGVNVSDDATNNKTIVDISGGGGVYIEKTLWEDVNGLQFAPNNIQTITLSESLNKYDFIYVDVSSVADSEYHNQNILAVSSLYNENDGYNGTVCIGGNIDRANSFAKVDNTHLKFIGFSSAQPLIVWKVVGIKVSGDYYAPVIYSTEEREIGVWTDGKPLYEKTLAIPSLSAGSNTIQHNIANFDKMISCQGRINYDGDDLVVPYMQTQVTSGYVAYGIGISNFNSTRYFIILGNMFDVSKFSGGYVTVRYTKTTDVAGSGTWTTQGVPTHHYSTDEHIIGTYLGDTLYEKTYTGLSVQAPRKGEWNNTGIDATNFSKIIDGIIRDAYEQKLDGTIGFVNNNTEVGVVVNLDNRTITNITIQYTKSS